MLVERPVRECKPSKKCQKHFFDTQRLRLLPEPFAVRKPYFAQMIMLLLAG